MRRVMRNHYRRPVELLRQLLPYESQVEAMLGSVRGGGVISGGAFGGNGGGESAAFLAKASVGTGTV